MLNNVIFAWVTRRAMELGGIFGALFLLYQGLPPGSQAAVQRLFTGGWKDVTLGALVPVAIAVWGYAWSYVSSTKSQVIVDNRQVPIKELPAGKQTVVKETARTAIEKKPPTLWERLTSRS